MEPLWVGVLMTIMTGVGALIPKITDFFVNKNKADKEKKQQEQSDIDFIVKNYRQLNQDQTDRACKLETKLLEVQQHILDMQTAHIVTLTENVSLKQKISTLEAGRDANTVEIQKLKEDNSRLRAQIEELERRLPK